MAWGCAYLRAGCERRVAATLMANGIDPYLPQFKNRFRHRQLLLPRYIFIRLGDKWRLMFRVKGVIRLLMSGEKPAIIVDAYIRNLKRQEDDDGLIELGYRYGQRLQVVRGQFKDMIATFERSDRGKEIATVEAMGRKVRVEFKPEQLVPEL